MHPPVHVTLHVTQDCIDQATLTPTNCPVARAATGAGPAELVSVSPSAVQTAF